MILNVLGKQFPPGLLGHIWRWGMETWGSWISVTLMGGPRPVGLTHTFYAWIQRLWFSQWRLCRDLAAPCPTSEVQLPRAKLKALCRAEEASTKENIGQKVPEEINSYQRPQLSGCNWLWAEREGEGWELREGEKTGRTWKYGVWFIASPLLRDKWYLWRVKKQQLSVQIMGWDKRFYGFPSGYIKSIKHKRW